MDCRCEMCYILQTELDCSKASCFFVSQCIRYDFYKYNNILIYTRFIDYIFLSAWIWGPRLRPQLLAFHFGQMSLVLFNDDAENLKAKNKELDGITSVAPLYKYPSRHD